MEEDHVKIGSKIDLHTNKLIKGDFKLLLKRSKILLIQEDYDVAFAVDAKKISGQVA